MGQRTSIYLTDDLKAKLKLGRSRGLSEALNMAIDRYQEIIDAERKRMNSIFTEGEWNAMRNSCNGTLWVPAALIRGGVLANIEDSLDEEIESFGADRETLEGKLRELTVVQQFALVDMIEQWWDEQSAT